MKVILDVLYSPFYSQRVKTRIKVILDCSL